MVDLNFNYSKRDPDDVLAWLETQLSGLTNQDWTNFKESDPGKILLKALTVLGDKDAYFSDRNTAETFLSLCSTREAAIRRAKELGYIPYGITSSTVPIQFTATGLSSQLIIPAYSSWVINGINFVNRTEIVVSAGTTSFQATLTQGTYYTSTSTASGLPWAKIAVPINVYDMVVTVNGTVWSPVDTFIGAAEHTYKVYEDVDGDIICFDGTIGNNAPTAGETIVVQAILSNGEDGNIQAKNQTVVPTSQLVDVNGSNVTNNIRGTTLAGALGGSPVESIDSIRQNAPASFGAQDRAVSIDDYIAFARTIPGITDCNGYGGETIGKKGYIYLFVYGGSPYTLSSDLQTLVLNAFAGRYLDMFTLVVSAPNIVEVAQTAAFAIASNTATDAATARDNATTNANAYFESLETGSNLDYTEEGIAIKQPGVKLISADTSLRSFATSTAGLITIALCQNPDVTNCTLKTAAGTVLFTGDGTQYLSGTTFTFKQIGLSDTQCFLTYKPNSDNVNVSTNQLIVLTSFIPNMVVGS